MNTTIEAPTQASNPTFRPIVDTPLSPTAVWSVAYRAVESLQSDLPSMCDASPEAVERAAALACRNLCATMPVTQAMQDRSRAEIDDVEPLLGLWYRDNMLKLALGQMVTLGRENLQIPPGPEPQPVDDEAAQIITAALTIEAQTGSDPFARAEAADVLTNGLPFLQGSVSVVA